MGFQPVFQFDVGTEMPPQYYWHIVILGVILGIMGAFYNKMTMWVQGLYLKSKKLNETTRLFIPFFLAGVLGLLCLGFWEADMLLLIWRQKEI